MEILVYSQQGNIGGSTRLLLNLARHLAREHSVCVAFGTAHTPQASDVLLAQFPELRLIPGDPEIIRRRRFDVAILHLPFAAEDVENFDAPRKIAVVMELVARHPIAVREEHCALFERILHLHREQVQHLSPASRAAKCTLLPVIDNIDFDPQFVPACCIGCVVRIRKQDVVNDELRRTLEGSCGDGIGRSPELALLAVRIHGASSGHDSKDEDKRGE